MMKVRASLILTIVLAGGVRAAQAPRVQELRTQRVGDTTYFHVRFEPPPDMAGGAIRSENPELDAHPRLVPQDGKAHAVYQRFEGPNVPGGMGLAARAADDPAARPPTPAVPLERQPPAPGAPQAQAPVTPVPVQGLEFVGTLHGEDPAKFLLLYPVQASDRPHPLRDRLLGPMAARRPRPPKWAEVPVELDFTKAKKVPLPAKNAQRRPGQPPAADDLKGLWASGQVAYFDLLDGECPEFGFYSFAREATARKYGVPSPMRGAAAPMGSPYAGAPGRPGLPFGNRLYETTTGAAAIAESLQLQRMLTSNVRDKGERTIDVTKIPGIDIAEHPWEKMMDGKKPSPDPLARLVPFDNYYVRFKSIRKFLDFGDLTDHWGTSIARGYEVHSRDYGIRPRYMKQLCLRSTGLARTLGPTVIRGLAITGSDGFLREGSDVTVILQTVDPQLVLGAVEPFVQEARKEYGDRLKEDKTPYHGTTIESFVTPLREVSLHRAVLGEYVLYSNSPVGLRRVLDAQAGRIKPLADSLDYQYMRTIFRLEDKAEDGFAFLSDPFIRRQVGPAVKIKEKRRLEALTSLYMLSHGALFTAWETGKLPTEQKNLLAASTLKLEELYVPEGKDVTWDSERQVAVSEVYNTLQFATPLIELPIDKVTPQEQQEYTQFRAQYLGLWRQFFDPVGLRLSLNDRQVKLETYILPLIQNSTYNELRRWTGGGTVKLDPSRISPKTLIQFQTHIATDLPERRDLWRRASEYLALLDGKVRPLDFLGDWFLIRLDENDAVDTLAGYALDALEGNSENIDERKATRVFFQIPLTLGVSIRDPLVFAPLLAGIRAALASSLPGAVTWEPMEAYKGVQMVRVQATPNGEVTRFFNDPSKPMKNPFTPRLFYALIDGGWYLSVTDAALRDIVDETEAQSQGKGSDTAGTDINCSLYVAPGAASPRLRALLSGLLEKQCYEQARANTPAWYAFYRSGLLDEKSTPEQMAATARHYLGYVPVSPDGAAYTYEPRTDEVVNRRHGSLRRPTRHRGVEPTSPLGQLLEQIRSVRADLRFKEDGVYTTLTIGRAVK